jgi:HEPN domain-containing protein
MDSASDAEYRLRLARGFLTEAEEDLQSSRWRSCVDNAQLAVENAAKSAIARFGPVPRSHDTSAVLNEHLQQGSVPPELRDSVERLRELSGQLGFEEHVRSDYGDEARGITPWELFQETDAGRAIAIARRAVDLAGRLART